MGEASNSPPASWSIDLGIAAVIAVSLFLLYSSSAPAIVNLDGLGYLKLLPHNFAAGHLLYMPLLRLAARFARGNGLVGGRALSALSGAFACGVLYGCARQFAGRAASLFATAALAFSFAVWVESADVEVYAPALAATLVLLALCLAYRHVPSVGLALGVALALAAAILLHLTHVLLAAFTAAWLVAHARNRRQGVLHAALALSTAGGVTLGTYAWAALVVRRHDLAGAWRWIAAAGHGFAYHGGLVERLGDGLYGLAKAFVWSPYLYESNAQRLLGQLLLGLAAVGLLTACLIARRRQLAALPIGLLAVWVIPYAALALLYFGSDHERWIFVLPIAWLGCGCAIDGWSRGRAIGAGLVAYLLVANATTAILPARRDFWARSRADAAVDVIADGDLVVFPGHSWDEYIGFPGERKLRLLPLAYYAGLGGKDACLERVEREIGWARVRGAHVYLVRIFDTDDDRRGFFELDSLGLGKPALQAYFARYRIRPVGTVEPKVTVWRLEE